jgi:hypothetical protein
MSTAIGISEKLPGFPTLAGVWHAQREVNALTARADCGDHRPFEERRAVALAGRLVVAQASAGGRVTGFAPSARAPRRRITALARRAAGSAASRSECAARPIAIPTATRSRWLCDRAPVLVG